MDDDEGTTRVRLLAALAEVYAGADLDDVDALLDQMTDRGLTVADLAAHMCSPCPHIHTSDEGTSYCDLAEQTTYVSVGVDYCVQHHGIRDEDESECDYKAAESRAVPVPFPCNLRPLVYAKGSRA